MSKTNSLTSHWPEHSSHPANKPLPLEYAHNREITGIGQRVLAKMHNARSRRYARAQINAELVSYTTELTQ